MIARVDVLGVRVSAITLDEAVRAVEGFAAAGGSHYVCVTGAHGVIESRGDARLRRIHDEADLVTPDGMPLVWMARLLGFRRVTRVYGPDLMRAVMARSAGRGLRHYFCGGPPGLADALMAGLEAAHPGLEVVGAASPPFGRPSPAEDAALVEAINAARPDIVWVGLSTPKQEAWMHEHLGRIEAPVMIGVGAAFDFLAGRKRQAPVAMQRAGLEWLFRLATEPRRLGLRYAKVVPLFLALAAVQLARHRLRRVADRAGRPRLTG